MPLTLFDTVSGSDQSSTELTLGRQGQRGSPLKTDVLGESPAKGPGLHESCLLPSVSASTSTEWSGWRVWAAERPKPFAPKKWKVVLVEINLKSTRRHVVGATGFVGGDLFRWRDLGET